MIISRKEFHQRHGSLSAGSMVEEKEEFMSVDKLYKEIQLDAPFRNHNYMFDKDIDWKKLNIQENIVGIMKKFPHIKTEGERYEKVKQEVIDSTYKSVPVLRDSDYPEVIYVDDGFHRIYAAHELGHRVMRIKAKYGKYTLDRCITLKDLSSLLDMISKLFGKEYDSIIKTKNLLDKVIKKKPEMGESYSISYGGRTK